MRPQQKNNFWFVLGREELISAAELRAVLNSRDLKPKNGLLKSESDIEPAMFIKKVGGVIKIGKEIASGISEKNIIEIISNELKNVDGKINFGISVYGLREKFARMKSAKEIGIKIKKMMKELGYSIRYVENKDATLSSVTVEKNGLVKRGREFMLEEDGDKISIAVTMAVQPFEEFSARDFGRPGRDNLSGMLPPKLAMMMINLSQTKTNEKILDPFCGSGTILSEAMLMGYKNLIGSDSAEKAVEDTINNIKWIAEKFNQDNPDIDVFKCQVELLDEKISADSIDAIVTEPFLGKPLKGREVKEELIKQANELKSFYLETLKIFKKILKPGGRVVIVIPRFKFNNEWVTISIRDEAMKLGLKPDILIEDKQFLLYSRPDQRVGREIWKFIKPL